MEKLRRINTTLVLIEKDNKILLGQKKRGFAKGTFNGIGGKQDPGETIEQTMIRECQEEIGATPTKYEQAGYIHFDVWYKGERVDMCLYIYSCSEYSGEIVETEEMIPQWFDKQHLPYDKMLEDDKLWYAYFLQGKKFVGDVVFDQDMKMLSNKFEEVNDDKIFANL